MLGRLSVGNDLVQIMVNRDINALQLNSLLLKCGMQIIDAIAIHMHIHIIEILSEKVLLNLN